MALATIGCDDVLNEPMSYKEAMSRDDRKMWEKAAHEEMDSIHSAGTWILVPRWSINGQHVIGCKWVFKLKLKSDNTIDKHKARLVGKGYSQKEHIDYTETFSPVAKFSSIRALLALAAYYDLEIHQMDVKCAFLNGDIEEDIYMEQPEGFEVKGKEDWVCKLQKSLYGLKQAGRAWYEKIDGTMLSMSFKKSDADVCVYVYQSGDIRVYVALYVDDLLIFANNMAKLKAVKDHLSAQYQMKDMGEAQYVLGIQITRDRQKRTLSLCQTAYIENILKRHRMENCGSEPTPLSIDARLSKEDCPKTEEQKQEMKIVPYQNVLGAIMYCMLGTRPDIAYAVTALSQYSSCYGKNHWRAVKRLMRYLNGTKHYKLTYGNRKSSFSNDDAGITGYCDADWANNPDDRRSYTGYVFMLAGGAISWQAKKQSTVALSSMEAEYMSAAKAAQETIWWRTFLNGIGMDTSKAMPLLCDNQGAIDLAKNPEFHARSKHIDTRHHFIRERVADKSIHIEYISTDMMPADILTKGLSKLRHQSMIKLLGLES